MVCARPARRCSGPRGNLLDRRQLGETGSGHGGDAQNIHPRRHPAAIQPGRRFGVAHDHHRANRPRTRSARPRQRPRRALRRVGRDDPRRHRPRHRHRHRQERPCRPQDRRHARLDRHAGLLRPSGRGQPRRPRHDHRATTSSSRCPGRARRRELQEPSSNMRGASDIPLDRHDRGRRQHARPRRPTSCWRCRAADEACPHGLAPTTSTLMQLALGDALAIALLESRGFTRGGFPPLPSRRPARRQPAFRPRHHAPRRRAAAGRRSARRWARRSP